MLTSTRDIAVAEAVVDLAARHDDFDTLAMLHDTTDHAAALLGIPAAGITVLDEQGRVDYLTASDETCRALEEAQIDFGEGPCVDVARSRDRSTLGPIALAPAGPAFQRWPRFTGLALRAGITAVAAVQLRGAEAPLGALNLMTDGPAITNRDLRLAEVLAEATAGSLRHRWSLRAKDDLIDQLESALHSRVVIEQAKGVLSARLGVTVDEAFTRLRRHARSHHLNLSELARQVARGAAPLDLESGR